MNKYSIYVFSCYGLTAFLYTEMLPDLFREGQNIVAQGTLKGHSFYVQEILAKHDATYKPKY